MTAEGYRLEFGGPIRLDGDCPNAGYQWIKDFLTNEPIQVLGSYEIAEAVGAPDQTDPPLGIVSYAQYHEVSRQNLYFEPAFDLIPFAGVPSRSYLAIANGAPHPNAAKLMILWLIGDPQDETMGGFGPWWRIGEWSPRDDIPDPERAIPWSELEARLRAPDSQFAYGNADEVKQFWVSHAP